MLLISLQVISSNNKINVVVSTLVFYFSHIICGYTPIHLDSNFIYFFLNGVSASRCIFFQISYVSVQGRN